MSDDIDSKNGNIENDISKTIEITKSSSIVISKSVWKNQERLDIRTYIKTENYTGPTKKGINVPFEKIDEIMNVLTDIKDQTEQK